MALYVYHPPSITSTLKGKYKVKAMENHLEHQQEFLHILKDSLVIPKNRMKQADQHHSERCFEENWVFLRMKPYK